MNRPTSWPSANEQLKTRLKSVTTSKLLWKRKYLSARPSAAKGCGATGVLINLEASPEIDFTCLEMLEQLKSELEKSDIDLYLARVSDRARDLFARSSFLDRLGETHIFPGVDAAVNMFLKPKKSSVSSPTPVEHTHA